ncbi:MAG: cell division protein FtsQ, partial [Acetobacteraceae bacterium]
MPIRIARLQALAAIALLLWGAGQGIAALADPASRQRLVESLTWEAFLAGRTAGAINHVMAHALPADPWLRAAGGLLRWGLFRSGGPQVAVGCDGWLFLTEELRPWPGAQAAMAARAAALGRIAAALRERGITLVVAITPDKARVNPERLCAARTSAQAGRRHAEATTLLRQASG